MINRGWSLPRVLRVEVEESFGQSAEVEWRRKSTPLCPLKPYQLPAADPPIMYRRADQDQRRSRISQVYDFRNTGDPAPDSDRDLGIFLRIHMRHRSVPAPSPVPTRLSSSWRVAPFAMARPAISMGSSVIQSATGASLGRPPKRSRLKMVLSGRNCSIRPASPSPKRSEDHHGIPIGQAEIQ